MRPREFTFEIRMKEGFEDGQYAPIFIFDISREQAEKRAYREIQDKHGLAPNTYDLIQTDDPVPVPSMSNTPVKIIEAEMERFQDFTETLVQQIERDILAHGKPMNRRHHRVLCDCLGHSISLIYDLIRNAPDPPEVPELRRDSEPNE